MKESLIDIFKNTNIPPDLRVKTWRNTLQLLKERETPLSEEEMKDSLLNDIQDLCDFIGEEEQQLLISNLYHAIADGTPQYWNKSIQDMIQYLIDNFLSPTENTKYGALNLTLQQVQQQDAGNSFEQSPWVAPNVNIDGETYDNVRKNDSVLDILKSDKYLQFTCEQNVKEWLRLIMPQYSRRVEIEDLDRNFWTTAQALTTLSSYLLDPDSPLLKLLNNFIDEIAQLWENMLYLWIQMAYLSQRRDKEVRAVYFYLNPNNPNQFIRKFDNFDMKDCYTISKGFISTLDMQLIYDRVNSVMNDGVLNNYKDKYPNENIVLIPIVRIHNYYKNYYSTEVYTSMYCLHRSSNKWSKKDFCNNVTKEKGLVFSMNSKLQNNITANIGEYITAFNQEEFGYKTYYNFNKLSSKEEIKVTPYFGAIRVVPKPEIFAVPGGFSGKLKFIIEDAAECIGKNNTNSNTIITVTSDEQDWKEDNTEPFYFTADITPPQREIDTEINFYSYSQNINGKSLYLGETPSYYVIPRLEPIFEDATFEMVKIGDSYPTVVDPKWLVPITKKTGIGYTTDTYGKGGYYCPLAYLSNGNLGEFLNFFAYSGANISKLSFSLLTPEKVTALGVSQIKSLYQQNGVFTQTSLIATKIGLGFWVGAGGSVWSYGIVTDLFAIIKGEEEPIHLSVVNRLDGYWNMKTTVTGQYTISVDGVVLHIFHQDAIQGRYRNLTLRADKVLRKYTDETSTWEMVGGEWIWNDHTQGDIIVAKCQMGLEDGMLSTQDSYYLSILPSAGSTIRTDNYNIRTDIAIPLKNNNLSELKDKSILSTVVDYFDGHGTIGVSQFGYNPSNKIFK